jgi:hypothetical protein
MLSEPMLGKYRQSIICAIENLSENLVADTIARSTSRFSDWFLVVKRNVADWDRHVD